MTLQNSTWITSTNKTRQRHKPNLSGTQLKQPVDNKNLPNKQCLYPYRSKSHFCKHSHQMSNQTTPIQTKHTDLSLASNEDDDNSQRPTVSGAGSSLYKFDPVNQRQDSQYFDTESIGRSTLALNASDEANINEMKTKPPPKPISRDGPNTTSKNKEKEVVIIRSMSMLKNQKRKARRKKHVRRELNKEERHHLHAKELELFMNAENEIFQHVYLSQTKKKVLAFFESSPTEIVMVLLTVFALYGSDVADAHFSMETDLTIDILIWVVMFLFLIENYALARGKY